MRNLSGSQIRALPIGLALLTVMVQPGRAAAQESPPLVRTAFVLESAEFRSTYGATTSKLVEDSLAAELARQMRGHYPFLRWTPAGEPGTDTITTELRLTMTSRSGGFAPVIELMPTTVVDSLTMEDLDPPIIPLYGSFDRQPTQNPQQLLADIADTLTAVFRNDGFRTEFHEHLLTHIPLVDQVEVLEGDRQIAIPLRWDDLSAGTESVFRVTFVSEPPASTRADGSMELRVQGRLFVEGEEGPAIRCTIILFDFPRHTLEQPGVWFPELPTIIEHIEDGSLKVFMRTYRFDPRAGAEGGLVTRLPEGGGS